MNRSQEIALCSAGVCLPRYRLAAATVAQAWGGRSGSLERAVANYDEDALTLAATAAAAALEQAPEPIDAVFFVSSTAPYREKLHAAFLAAVLDLGRDVLAVDQGGSPRAALTALHAAADAIRSGSRRRILVVFSECRTPAPGSDAETRMGDGAAAFVLSGAPSAAPLAWWQASAGITEDFPDQWRREGAPFHDFADPRFVQTLGYERLGREAVERLLGPLGLSGSDVQSFSVAAPDERTCRGVERAAGIGRERCAGHAVVNQVGDTGAAGPALALLAALENAEPGALVVNLCFGAGAEASLWRAGEGVDGLRRARPLACELQWKRPLEHYGRYLQARALLGEKLPTPFSSPILLWREHRSNLGLIAHRCRRCGNIEFPAARICGRCRSKDEFDEYRLARRGKIFTFTHDHLSPTPFPPTTMAVVDLEGGGRFYGQLTDCPPAGVCVGMAGELVLRRLHDGAGLYNYFWKLRPLPPGES